MPYFDLPFWHQAGTPRFDPMNLCSIWHYFEDLELLLVKHKVLSDAEKKQAAVNYLDIEVECLWKFVLSFSDPIHSYEDFKAEIIRMYPKVSVEHLYTIFALNLLISNCACSLIQSAKELGKYHQDFHTLAHNLVKLNCIGVPDQGQYFLAVFEPILASTV